MTFRYLVIRGIAAVLYGVPRATFDLDILIDATEANASKLLKALDELGFGTAQMTTPTEIVASEITTFTDRIRLDVQTLTPGLTFADAWQHRVVMDYKGQEFQVVSLPDLLRSQRAAGREVDLKTLNYC